MNLQETRKKLIDHISKISDAKFLGELEIILSSKSKSDIIKLSTDIKNDISKSKLQYQQNDFTTDNILNEKIESWLKE